ncbi:MAG: 4Fe-4S binding protein [Desulfomonile sp.]
MFKKVTTTIDKDLCTGCSLCVEVCPARTLSMHIRILPSLRINVSPVFPVPVDRTNRFKRIRPSRRSLR